MTSALLARPTALTVTVTSIPEALRRERRWVVWRYVLRDGRWTKLPFQVSGVMAKANDLTTWTTFKDVLAAYGTGRFDGVGFVLGDGWAGVDFDHVNCHLIAAAPLVGRLRRCYRETSPGQEGLKAIGRAERIGGEVKFDLHASKAPTFTRWMGARFFTVTGHGEGDPLADLSALIDEWFPAAPALLNLSSSTGGGYAGAAELNDFELLAQMIGGRDVHSVKRLALWQGDASAHGNDHSRADLALCCHLAWFTNYDPERIDRLFRQSGLMRDKWKNQASYRRATLAKALARRDEIVGGEISYE